jgi:hypothetical protein
MDSLVARVAGSLHARGDGPGDGGRLRSVLRWAGMVTREPDFASRSPWRNSCGVFLGFFRLKSSVGWSERPHRVACGARPDDLKWPLGGILVIDHVTRDRKFV